MRKLGCPMRLVFLVMSLVISAGIYLTGVNSVHWLLFVPPVIMLFVAVTGICMGAMLFAKICR